MVEPIAIEDIPNPPDISPGYQTTEFWGKNAVQLLTLAASGAALYYGHTTLTPQQQMDIAKLAGGVIAGLEGLYHTGRVIVKSKGGTQ